MSVRMAFLASCAFAVAALFAFLRWHRQGLAVRAVAQNPEAAQAMGIHLARIFSLTLALGVALAGVGGALMAPLFNVYPAVGFPLTIKAFAITILGGMGNLAGALLASLIIGVAESMVVIVVPSQWQNGVAFLVMIAVLLPAEDLSAKAGIMLSMYLLGTILAFVMAWVFKKTLLKSETPMLLLELPPYRLPGLRSILLRMWERGMIFLRRAGTVILARAAAADMYPADLRARGISLVLFGAVFGAALGPLVFRPLFGDKHDVDADGLVVPWLVAGVIMVVGLVISGLVRPDPKQIGEALSVGKGAAVSA